MFTVKRNGENRLDIVLSGKLHIKEMKTAINELLEASEGIENGVMLYEIIDFRLPSLGAIAVEFSRLPSMTGLLHQFDRAAVLTDNKWLKMISRIESALYPGIEIKPFNRDQKAEAEEWLYSG